MEPGPSNTFEYFKKDSSAGSGVTLSVSLLITLSVVLGVSGVYGILTIPVPDLVRVPDPELKLELGPELEPIPELEWISSSVSVPLDLFLKS